VNRWIATLGALVLALVQAGPARAASHRGRRARPPLRMALHVETLDGSVVEDRDGGAGINPASVVKVATSLWALERLGPDRRFETRFYARGRVDPAGEVHGDLVVQGGGDPDFQVENAFLVSLALERAGVRRVRGALIVTRTFWIGWENGSAGMEKDPVKRGLVMAMRLRDALDSRRWRRGTRAAWRAFALRHDLNPARPPRVQVLGGVGVDGASNPGKLLLVHRSKPLVEVLHRFNAFSNNDIERIGGLLGSPSELADLVAARCDVPRDEVRLETTSGLGSNQLSPRAVVRLLRELRRTCDRLGLRVQDVLALGGCDPGTVSRFFPLLARGPWAATLVGKTGTLTATDGGVSVLAGFLSAAEGELVFCVAVPDAAGHVSAARRAEERLVLEMLRRFGGGSPLACGNGLVEPDDDSTAVAAGAGEPGRTEATR
jgi:D-alanyl-D-alanine carboxypeptidase/D-alanyl-D-alanine-endopeptidase (penicillin-binding protein 4)